MNAGVRRSSIFNKEFMTKNFGEQHKQAFNEDIPAGGHPDCGDGRYSKKLPYEEWLTFNNGQRAHRSFMEWLASTLFLGLCSGLFLPFVSAILQAIVALGRLLAIIGYMKNPKLRSPGIMIAEFAGLAQLGIIIYGVVVIFKN
jgi:MAPEG family